MKFIYSLSFFKRQLHRLFSGQVAPLFVCLAGFLVRFICILLCEYGIYSDSAEFIELASNLIAGKGFYLHGGLSAYRMPGYPLVIALLLRISGNLLWLKAVQAIEEVATGWLIYLVGRRHFSKVAALGGLVIWSILPVSVVQPLTFMSEGLFTFIFMVMVYFATGKPGYRSSISAGACCGIMALIKAQMLLFPAVFIMSLLMKKLRPAKVLRYGVVFSLPIVVVLTPWVFRNYHRFGAFIINTNGGQNLYIGNNPRKLPAAIMI